MGLGKAKRHSPTPFPNFYCSTPPWYKFLSLLSLPLSLKSKMGAIIFAKKTLKLARQNYSIESYVKWLFYCPNVINASLSPTSSKHSFHLVAQLIKAITR